MQAAVVEAAVAEFLEHFAYVIRLNHGVNARSNLVSGPGCSCAAGTAKGPGQAAGCDDDKTPSMRTRSLASARVARRSWIAGEPPNRTAQPGDVGLRDDPGRFLLERVEPYLIRLVNWFMSK